jgi:hypothetical protein
MLDAAADLDVAFEHEADRESARNLMGPVAAHELHQPRSAALCCIAK